MGKPDANDNDIVEANKRISRPEDEGEKARQKAVRRLRVDMPAEAAGASLASEEDDDGETGDALRRATEERSRRR